MAESAATQLIYSVFASEVGSTLWENHADQVDLIEAMEVALDLVRSGLCVQIVQGHCPDDAVVTNAALDWCDVIAHFDM